MLLSIKPKLLLTALFLAVSAIGLNAQNKSVTVKSGSSTVGAVLAQIEQQTGYIFEFDGSDIDTERSVNVDMKDVPTSDVLKAIFPSSAGVKWTLNGHKISLTAKNKTKSNKVAAGKRELSGTVRDAKDGEPLVGAVVKLQGDDKNGAVVDVDGNFFINIDDSDGRKPVLEVSFVGYTPREVPVKGLTHIDIDMTGAANSLDEVIVVGSGLQKRVSVTGAISTISGEQLSTSTTTLSRALGGKISGVISRQVSGEPGTGAEFYIRGISTFGGKATPLILLDDVEITASDLDFIPAENIESFSILKDASATAIYGARGANGVMIVTTKGGEFNSKTKITVKIENAFNYVDNFPEWLDGANFMRIYNKANESRNPGATPFYSDLAIERTESHLYPYHYPDVDWQSELYNKMAMRQRANLSVSGGGARAKYYMSIDARHENGLQKTDKVSSFDNNLNIYNYTFQNNISYKLTTTTNLSLNINAQIRQRSSPSVGAAAGWSYVYNSNPVEFPMYYPSGPDGEVRYGSKLATNAILANPKAAVNQNYFQQNLSTVNSVLKLDQDLGFITKGLKLNAWVNWRTYHADSYTQSINVNYWYLPVDDNTDLEAEINPVNLNPEVSKFIWQSGTNPSGNTTFEFQGNLNWTRRFGLHDITAMLLYRVREYRSNAAVLPNRNQGVSGRVTYDYDHRYLFEFNFGYNGSERLTKAYRYGFFPAGSVGWVISNENFWEPLRNVVTNMKIRASYGLVGSDDLARPDGTYYLYMDQLTNNDLNYMGWTTGDGYSSYLGSSPLIRYYALNNVTWEKSRKFDVGVDFTLFRNLHGTFEYFREDRYDIFMQRGSWPWSLGYGLAIPWANTGKALNQGFEFSLNYNKAFSKDLSVSLQANFTYNQNKFVDKDEPQYKYPWLRVTGKPLDNYRFDGYIAEGLFRSQEEIDNSPEQQVGTGVVRVGDIKYRDLNGDGKVNADDKTMISKYGRMPRIMYGFGATVNWRKWDFGFFFTGTGCRTISIANKIDPRQDEYGRNLNVLSWINDNYFDPDKGNFEAEYPLLGVSASDISNNNVYSTYWLRDGSYLRLRSVELGWRFKFGRVYVEGTDLLCFSKFKIWDPEFDSHIVYPMQKTVNVGVQFDF